MAKKRTVKKKPATTKKKELTKEQHLAAFKKALPKFDTIILLGVDSSGKGVSSGYGSTTQMLALLNEAAKHIVQRATQ